MRAYAGIDVGTTNVKVVIVDFNGRALARRSEPTPRRNDEFGVCSDPAEIVATVERLVTQAFGDAELREPLAAICATGTGEDGVVVDTTGRPQGLAIAWFDDRATDDARELRSTTAAYQARTGLEIERLHTLAKWRWLSRRPGFRRETDGVWIALTDYPAYAWTRRPFMSETLAVRTAAYDCVDRRWIVPLLDRVSAPPVPPVVAAGRAVGTVVAGPLLSAAIVDYSTVVAAGGHDHPIAASAILAGDRTAVLDSMGTAELVYALTDAPFDERPAPRYVSRSVPVDGGSGSACLGPFEFTWQLERLMADASPRANALRAVIAGAALPGAPGASGRLFFPLDAESDSEAFAAEHTDALWARALLEGYALHTRRILEAVVAASGARGPVYTTGGWTNASTLVKLRADVFAMPLFVVDEPQLAAYGAARCALRAVGIDNGEPRITASRVDNDAPLAAVYDRAYAIYKAHVDRS